MPARERIERNERLFREVNERIREIGEDLEGYGLEELQFFCECGRRDCALRITLELEEYEAVRADPTHFLVAHGHELPETGERVVARHETYTIVEKPWID